MSSSLQLFVNQKFIVLVVQGLSPCGFSQSQQYGFLYVCRMISLFSNKELLTGSTEVYAMHDVWGRPLLQ